MKIQNIFVTKSKMKLQKLARFCRHIFGAERETGEKTYFSTHFSSYRRLSFHASLLHPPLSRRDYVSLNLRF
jgi:hypothetical protein